MTRPGCDAGATGLISRSALSLRELRQHPLAVFVLVAELLAVFKINRIDRFERHKLFQLDAAVRFCLQWFQLFIRDLHVFVFADRSAADKLVARHNFLLERAKELILNPIAALGVLTPRQNWLPNNNWGGAKSI
jgi:hypothetical protein